MAVWKLKGIGPVSAATGEPLGPDVEIVTALFGAVDADDTGDEGVRGTGFLRKDFLVEEATEEALAGAYCTWRTRTAPAKPQDERRFDLGMAREFLERLLREQREDRAAVCLTLALLLARKRRLVILEQGADTLTARWPREKQAFVVPAPEVSEADAEALQQDLLRLFNIEIAQPAAPEETTPPEGAPEETTALEEAGTAETGSRGDGASEESGDESTVAGPGPEPGA